MSGGFTAALSAATEPVAWVLIHSLWLGGLIAVLLAVTLNLLRHKTPHYRYAIAGVALLLVMPLSVSLVTYDSASRNVASYSGTSATESVSESQPDAAVADGAGSAIWQEVGSFRQVAANSVTPWIILLWLCGVSAVSFYHMTGWWQSRRIVRLGCRPVPAEWNSRFERLCRRIGDSGAVRLLSSSLTRMPCVVGFIKPTILLPVTVFTGLEADDIEMILAHELAHIRRYDVLMNYVQTAIETLLFFNPAVWWISRQIRIEREHCCDDFAVSVCGDRVAYARALTNLESLRTCKPRLAAAADGTPLLSRVRRLIQNSGDRRYRPSFSTLSAFTLVILVTVGFGISAAFTPDSGLTESIDRPVTYQEQDDDIHGYWEIEPKNKGVMLTMVFDRRQGRTSSTYYEDNFVGLQEGDNVQFQLHRDAGTFFFEGGVESVDGEYWGEGECHFRSNPEFVEKMADLGYRIKSTRKAWELAIHNVTLDFAQGINDAGYKRISLDRLVELHIHRVTPEFIAELAELGYRDLPLDRLVEMRIHKATPEYIREMTKAGYDNLKPRELVEMRIHRVDPEYIQGFSDLGYHNLRSSKLVEMSIHRVTPRFVKELRELGYDDLNPSKLVEMQIHRVDADYIGALVALGIKGIAVDDLVAMRIHNVTPSWVESLIALGYDDLAPDDLVSMRIHDVTAEFIQDMHARGYDDLSPDDLIELRIHGANRHLRSRSTGH